MKNPKYGTNTFLRAAHITAPVMRGLEAAGVIHPIKSDKGWRMFSEADVKAVSAWKAARRRRKSGEPTPEADVLADAVCELDRYLTDATFTEALRERVLKVREAMNALRVELEHA